MVKYPFHYFFTLFLWSLGEIIRRTGSKPDIIETLSPPPWIRLLEYGILRCVNVSRDVWVYACDFANFFYVWPSHYVGFCGRLKPLNILTFKRSIIRIISSGFLELLRLRGEMQSGDAEECLNPYFFSLIILFLSLSFKIWRKHFAGIFTHGEIPGDEGWAPSC